MEIDDPPQNFLCFGDLGFPVVVVILRLVAFGGLALGDRMQVPDWLGEYAGMSFLAGVGSLMRAKQWKAADGRIDWGKFVTEGATAVGLGVGVIALGSWGHVEVPVLCGISVFAGWLGPAAVSEMVLARIGKGK